MNSRRLLSWPTLEMALGPSHPSEHSRRVGLVARCEHPQFLMSRVLGLRDFLGLVAPHHVDRLGFMMHGGVVVF